MYTADSVSKAVRDCGLLWNHCHSYWIDHVDPTGASDFTELFSGPTANEDVLDYFIRSVLCDLQAVTLNGRIFFSTANCSAIESILFEGGSKDRSGIVMIDFAAGGEVAYSEILSESEVNLAVFSGVEHALSLGQPVRLPAWACGPLQGLSSVPPLGGLVSN